MPRPRSPENKSLPRRWRKRQNRDGSVSYFYQVPLGQEGAWDGKKTFFLGHNLAEAHTEFGRRVGSPAIEVKTIGDLLDRYAAEVVPAKAAKTRQDNVRQIATLRKVFGAMPLHTVKPRHVYVYVDKRGARTAAHREIEVLSHAYTKAVQWGLLDRHPFKGEVRLEGEKPRDRYVEDWEISAVLSLPPMQSRGSVSAIQAYIRLKLLTGMRRSDLLTLRVSDLRDDGIHVQQSKGGKRQIFAWTDERRAAVEMAKRARPVDISPWLFCTRKGESYWDDEIGEPRGWKSMWQRFMTRVLRETEVKERFTEHDLRAKAGSDQESLERAQRLLGHLDPRTTNRVYRRKPEVT